MDPVLIAVRFSLRGPKRSVTLNGVVHPFGEFLQLMSVVITLVVKKPVGLRDSHQHGVTCRQRRS
jgi:hypothetical protein